LKTPDLQAGSRITSPGKVEGRMKNAEGLQASSAD
jgi:hypothetical protein